MHACSDQPAKFEKIIIGYSTVLKGILLICCVFLFDLGFIT